ncbi:MAG: MFS transporter [Phaeodactylibacter sp.]|nr:MFS transporter [Phaeodactylibacter sp.]
MTQQQNRWAVNLFFGVNGFLYTNYISRLPEIQAIYGLDNGAIGMVLLATAIGALIAMPFTGWLIVGNGSRKVTAVAGLLFSIGVALIGWMPNALVLGGFFFFMGLATGTMDVSMNAQAVLVEQRYKRPIMSSFHGIFSAGMLLGAGSASIFTYFAVPLGWHLVVVSTLGVAALLWAIRHLVRDASTKHVQKQAVFQVPSIALVGIGFIAFCCMLGEGAMANWSTNYMVNIAQASPAFAPMGLAAFSLAMMSARFGGDYVRARLGDRRLLITNSLMAAFGLAIVVLFPVPLVVMIGLLLVGLGLSVIVPIAYSIAGNTPGLSPGVGIGMVTTIGYSGMLLGPPTIGFLADWQGLRTALLFALLLFLIMAVLSLRFKPVAKGEMVQTVGSTKPKGELVLQD